MIVYTQLTFGFVFTQCGVRNQQLPHMSQIRTYKYWPEISSNANVFMPQKLEDRQLTQLPHTPIHYPTGVEAPLKHIRADIDMRGPERIHNQLIYKQYGIIALGGGALQPTHIDWIQQRVNKYIDFERFFAVWRIDPPWKAVSRRSQGKRAGGGKGKVHHFETPVRAGRILIEVAGIGEYEEVLRVLNSICKRLPIYSIPINQKIMDQLREEKLELDAKNYNPFEYRACLRKNFSDSQRRLGPRELAWGGTYY